MKGLLGFVLLLTVSCQAQKQPYQAWDGMRTRLIPVPASITNKIKKEYSNIKIDSCYVYDDGKPDVEFRFYAKQQDKVIRASFDKHGKPTESRNEISLQDTPEALQQIIANNEVQAEGIGRIFKMVTWLPKRKRLPAWHQYKERKKLPRRAKIEYMVEFIGTYEGKKLTVPMYFNESGHQANPGFR